MIQTAASLLSPAIDWPAGDIRHADAVALPSLPVSGRVPLLRCVSGAIDVRRGVNNCRCDVVKTLVFVKRPRVFKAASQSERGAVSAADVHNWRPTHARTRVKCHSANFISTADQG